jgi:outer membrane protein assembly factor BamB
VGGAEEEPVEVSRSAPIIALVDDLETQYAGTFETQFPPESAPTFAGAADADDFEFPHVKGHMRALDLSALPEGETTYDDADDVPGLVLFDVATLLPDHDVETSGSGCAFGETQMETNQCRRIFTNVGTTRTPITVGNLTTLQPMLGSGFTTDEATTLISRIHAGRLNGTSYEPALGGVDRSTLAVIEPSPVIAEGGNRATVMYFGGLDGMLHAVCADAGPGCPSVGTELWAFLPASELGKVATNTTRIDGSPKVADIFDSNIKAMRTVLVFQTGNQSPSAVYALDITDPTDPEILWEHTTDGAGGTVSMGWVSVLAQIKPVTFVQSALSEATSPNGFVVTALDTDDGDVLWTSDNFVYASSEIPVSGVPGGVTLIPNGSGDQIESILAAGLDGNVWLLSADDGENRIAGGEPLFKMANGSTAIDYRPIGSAPTLYRSLDDPSQLHALVATGGFADWNEKLLEWSPSDAEQFAFGFPISEETVVSFDDLDDLDDIYIELGAGNRAFSSAVVAGNELFITTDSENINSTEFGSASADTGRLYRASLSGEIATSYVVIRSGAAAIDFSMTTNTAIASGGGSVEKEVVDGFSEVGLGTETAPSSVASRRLWLRLR